MTDYVLTVPETVYVHARWIAEETAQSVDEVLLEHLQMLTLPPLSPSYRLNFFQHQLLNHSDPL
jgi:hypothetical protein